MSFFWGLLRRHLPVGGLAFLLMLALLFFVFPLKQRELWPFDLPGLSNKNQHALAEGGVFYLALNPGQNQVDRSTGFGHLQWAASLEADPRDSFYRKSVWYFPLELPQATAENAAQSGIWQCPLMIFELPDGTAAPPLIESCSVEEHLGAHSPSRTHFQMRVELRHSLAPGLYRMRVEPTDRARFPFLTTVAADLGEKLWLLPQSGGHLAVAELLFDLWNDRPKKSLFVAALMGLACLVAAGLSRSVCAAALGPALLSCAALGVTLALHLTLSPLYSGYDETHHVENAFVAMRNPKASGLSSAGFQAERLAFYSHAKQELVDAHFLRLHMVSPPPDGQCPHSIIGNCTLKPGPQTLYGWVWRSLPFSEKWKARLVQNIPAQRRVHQVFHLFLVGLTISLVCLSFGWVNGSIALAGVFSVYGCFHALWPAVTNDFVFLILGIWLAAGVASFFLCAVRWSTGFWAVLCGLGLWVLFGVDASWPAGVPPFAVVVVLSLVKLILPEGFAVPQRLSPTLPEVGAVHLGRLAVLVVLVVTALLAVFQFLTAEQLTQLPFVGGFVRTTDMVGLQKVFNLSAADHLRIFGAYATTALGAYNWGNTLLTRSLLFAFGLAALSVCASAAGFSTVRGVRHSVGDLGYLWLVTWAAMLVGQILIVLALPAHLFQAAPGHWLTFAQVRLSASGFAAFLVPFFLAKPSLVARVVAFCLPLNALVVLYAYRAMLY